MSKNYSGYALITIDGLSVGNTLKGSPVSVKVKPVVKQIKTDYSDGVYEERKLNEVVETSFTLPYTQENLVRYPRSAVFEGALRFVNNNANLDLVIPKASMTVTHDLNYKQDAYHSITIKTIALEDETQEKVYINGDYALDDDRYLMLNGNNKMAANINMQDGYTLQVEGQEVFHPNNEQQVNWGDLGGNLSDQTDLQEIINYNFNTVAEMQAAAYIVVGNRIQLWGYNNLFDNSAHKRIFSLTDDGTGIPFNGGFAILENVTVVNVKWFGAVGDGSTDDTQAFLKAFGYPKVYAPSGKYLIKDNLFTPSKTDIQAITGSIEYGFEFYGESMGNTQLVFDLDAKPVSEKWGIAVGHFDYSTDFWKVAPTGFQRNINIHDIFVSEHELGAGGNLNDKGYGIFMHNTSHLSLDRVIVWGFDRNIHLWTWASVLNNVRSRNCNISFYYLTGTSTTFNSCYSGDTAVNGYQIGGNGDTSSPDKDSPQHNPVGFTFNSCACDSTQGYAYKINLADTGTFNSPQTEGTLKSMFYLNKTRSSDGNGILINSPKHAGIASIPSTEAFMELGTDGNSCTVINLATQLNYTTLKEFIVGGGGNDNVRLIGYSERYDTKNNKFIAIFNDGDNRNVYSEFSSGITDVDITSFLRTLGNDEYMQNIEISGTLVETGFASQMTFKATVLRDGQNNFNAVDIKQFRTYGGSDNNINSLNFVYNDLTGNLNINFNTDRTLLRGKINVVLLSTNVFLGFGKIY